MEQDFPLHFPQTLLMGNSLILQVLNIIFVETQQIRLINAQNSMLTSEKLLDSCKQTLHPTQLTPTQLTPTQLIPTQLTQTQLLLQELHRLDLLNLYLTVTTACQV